MSARRSPQPFRPRPTERTAIRAAILAGSAAAVILLPGGLPADATADDLAALSDEFADPSTFGLWQDLGVVEGWGTPSFEAADIATTEPGRFHIVPGALTWFNHLRGLLFFKLVDGNFVATMRVRVLSRHDPTDPAVVPNRSFSLAGLFVHGPRPVFNAAPVPYTTDPVWPPGAFGSDYLPGTENYVFLSFGTAGNPGTRQFEIKATRNSVSRLYWGSSGVDPTQTEAWLQMARVGDTIVCLRRHAASGDWIVENRYPNPDHPWPDFGPTLQVGITAYTDWPTAEPFANGGLETSWHFNYAPPSDGRPDLVAQVDYFRIRRPDPALTEAVLQAMPVGYDPAANTTADPPVLLSSSPDAAPFLGDHADVRHDPFGEWATARFGAGIDAEMRGPGGDPDGDGVTNAEEFALGGDPLDPASAPRPEAVRDGDAQVFRFAPAVEVGARLEVSVSEDMEAWTTLATRSSGGGDWMPSLAGTDWGAAVLVDHGSPMVGVAVPVSRGRAFFRLAITIFP